MAVGYAAAGWAAAFGSTPCSGLLIGAGSSATFAPLLAHVSLWFTRRRGIAIAIVASGNYLAGTIWPPVVQHFIQSAGWRQTYIGIAVFCVASMLPLALLLRRPAPLLELELHLTRPTVSPQARDIGLSRGTLQAARHRRRLLLRCDVDASGPPRCLLRRLGLGPARGAQMLSLMLACGVVSRLTFGFICDRIGGLRTLLLGSGLQGVALLFFLLFRGPVSL